MRWLGSWLLSGLFMMQYAFASTLMVGQPAPDFTLADQHNKPQTLSKMQGQWLVLYFYPKDDTPGCTTEACNFRDNMVALQNKKAVVWGVSVDNNDSHAEFAEKYKLPFTLLADPGGKVAKKYDSLLNLLVLKVAKRNSFIVDPEGKIAKVYRKVDPESHVEEVIKDLELLQSRASINDENK